MHEMGIAMQVVEIVKNSIPPDMKDVPIEKINLKVGRLASVVPSSLRFCFEIISKDTPLSNAELNIEEIPVTAKCKDCQHEWIIDDPAFSCKSCGSGSITILSGRELEISSIEIADEAGNK